MTKEEFAEKINGTSYRNEVSNELGQLAFESGLVAIFGASDDCMEFRGRIYDEIGAYEGASAVIFKHENDWNVEDLELEVDMDAYREVAARDAIKAGNVVKAIWCPVDQDGEIIATWHIQTKLPHAVFKTIDDRDGGNEVHTIGVVIDLKDLK